MKRITTTWITSLLLFATSVFAQSDVTVHVTDAGTASAIIGASVELNSTMLPTDGNGDAVFVALVDGSYPYTVTVNCYESGSGTVVVAGGNVIENIALTELTMATVFWNVAETSSMNSFPVAAASISMTNGNNSYTLAYGGFDNFMFEIPFGTYDYTISTDCHEDVTGTFTVDCSNIDPFNPDPTVAVWEVQGDELTMATVFWNVAETSSMNSFPVAAASISMTDGTNTYDLAYGGFDNFMFEIPFGTYDYTISTDCHEDATGTFTVDCANIDPFNPDPTVAVWEVQGDETVIDNTVTQDGTMLTANSAGLEYQWVDCDNDNEPIPNADGQSFAATVEGNYAVIITDGNCSSTSTCYNAVPNGVNEMELMGVSCYPNPVQDVLTVELKNGGENLQFEVVSVTGQVVYSINNSGDQIRMDLSKLTAGMYMLRVRSDKEISTMPLIKQ